MIANTWVNNWRNHYCFSKHKLFPGDKVVIKKNITRKFHEQGTYKGHSGIKTSVHLCVHVRSEFDSSLQSSSNPIGVSCP